MENTKMKPSGIEWIGMIPQHWEVDKIKYHLKRNEPKNPGGVQVLSVYREYGVIPKDSRDDNHNVTSQDTSKYKYVRPGDLVINKMKAWQGSLAVSEYEGIVSPAYFIYNFTDDKFNKRYFHFLIRSCYKDEFRRISGGIREGQWDLPAEGFANELVLLPPIDEQKAIVAFIDSKCLEIDTLVSDIQSQIDTLEQYKKSLIIGTINNGLNKVVEMKDSGIEWVGNTPAHWEVIPIRYLFREITTKNKYNQEQTALKFTYGTIIPKSDFDIDDDYVANTMLSYTVVEPGVIMINCLNLNYDFVSQRIGLVEHNGAITSAYLAIKPNNQLIPEFANYQLKSWDAVKAFHNMGSGIRKTLDFSELGKKKFLVPPIDEQKQIIDFLDQKTTEIDGAISDKKAQLETLAEYKKSLIYEYVTGKKQVKENA